MFLLEEAERHVRRGKQALIEANSLPFPDKYLTCLTPRPQFCWYFNYEENCDMLQNTDQNNIEGASDW